MDAFVGLGPWRITCKDDGKRVTGVECWSDPKDFRPDSGVTGQYYAIHVTDPIELAGQVLDDAAEMLESWAGRGGRKRSAKMLRQRAKMIRRSGRLPYGIDHPEAYDPTRRRSDGSNS